MLGQSGSHDQDDHHAHITRSDRFSYPSTFSSNISSNATGLIKAVFYMEGVLGQKMKVYLDGRDHMSKMAAMENIVNQMNT